MDSLFYRYRNITVLLVVIIAQIVLLGWQVRSDADVPMVRVWAVSAVTPVASAIESARSMTTGFVSNYFELRNTREESRTLHTEVERLTLENQLLRNELGSAQRAEQLAGFQAHNPSKMIGARVIGATPGGATKSVLIDRGSTSGIRRGMAVVTPDGIVGRVIEVFPFASQVLSVTDPGFAAGVESQRNHVHGVLKGQGSSVARVDYVPSGEKVDVGEMFYTSGEDRVFPKGLPVGKVTGVRENASFEDIVVDPSGTQTAPEEVLVILNPVHQAIPDAPPEVAPVFLAPDVPSGKEAPVESSAAPETPAKKLMDRYRAIGDAQKHTFGEGLPGSVPPNFNLKVPGVNGPEAPAGAQPAPTGKPSAAANQNQSAAAPKTPEATPLNKPPATSSAKPANGTPGSTTPPAPARTPAAAAPTHLPASDASGAGTKTGSQPIAAPKPVSPQSVSPEPATPEPATPESGTPQPGTAQPGAPQQGSSQPGSRTPNQP